LSNPREITQTLQIYFVLNGHPSQIYRSLINPSRRYADFDVLLEEVSRGLQIAIHRLYTYDGELIANMEQLLELKDNRVLAVPRRERLLLHGRSYSDLSGPTTAMTTGQLPPIKKARDSSESSSGNAVGPRYGRVPLSNPNLYNPFQVTEDTAPCNKATASSVLPNPQSSLPHPQHCLGSVIISSTNNKLKAKGKQFSLNVNKNKEEPSPKLNKLKRGRLSEWKVKL
jgi:hypothetical protein